MSNFLKRQKEPIQPIKFIDPDKDTAYKPIKFMDKDPNSRFNYAILKTTENGRYVRGNMLWYILNGVEIYTNINNVIFVDEANKCLFIRDNSSVVDEITPADPESKQYIILYTDFNFEDNEDPLRWESYIGRSNAYEAIKSNKYEIDPDRSLVLVDNVKLEDSLSVREFVEYLVNANIVEDEIDFDDID